MLPQTSSAVCLHHELVAGLHCCRLAGMRCSGSACQCLESSRRMSLFWACHFRLSLSLGPHQMLGAGRVYSPEEYG